MEIAGFTTYSDTHARVHEKRHGSNFVPRRTRRPTIAHKIRRHENITRYSTYRES